MVNIRLQKFPLVIHDLLGINIVVNKEEESACLNQHLYILNTLKKYGMENANPTSTPADVNVKLEKNDRDS